MRESKNFQTRTEKTDPRRSAWSFVSFDDCKKGETASKTGCTPASGEGTKKEGEGEKKEGEKKGTGKETGGIKEISERMDYLKSQMENIMDAKWEPGRREKVQKYNKEWAELKKKKDGLELREAREKKIQEGRDKMTPAEKRQEKSEENRMRRAYKKASREEKK